MSTTITTATFSATITEEITLNGQTKNTEVVQTWTDIIYDEVRTRSAATSVSNLATFGAAAAAGTFVDAKMRYFRITNYDDTNFITVGISVSAGDTSYHKVKAGDSFVYCTDVIDANTAGGAFVAFTQIDAITVMADTAACDIEYRIVAAI
jgi:hypothetical protein